MDSLANQHEKRPLFTIPEFNTPDNTMLLNPTGQTSFDRRWMQLLIIKERHSTSLYCRFRTRWERRVPRRLVSLWLKTCRHFLSHHRFLSTSKSHYWRSAGASLLSPRTGFHRTTEPDRSSKYNHPDPALKSKPSNPVLPIHASNVVAINKERPRRKSATATRERIPGVIAALHRQD